MTRYMDLETRLPQYIPFPRFLLKTKLSETEMLVYSLLLDRMTLSQKNGRADKDGHCCVVYTGEDLAEEIDYSRSSIKSALKEIICQEIDRTPAPGLLHSQPHLCSSPGRPGSRLV